MIEDTTVNQQLGNGMDHGRLILGLLLTCEKLSRAFQKNCTCLSVDISPTWYIVCPFAEQQRSVQ